MPTVKVMDTEQQPAKKQRDEESQVKFGWKLKPILAEELTQHPRLEKAFIGVLKEKRDISKAIVGLAKCLPSPQHLKRCSGLKIYLAPVEQMNDQSEKLKEFLIQNGFDLVILEDEFEIAEVSAVAPRTKSQMAYASKFWPVNFHPDLNLEAVISGSIFDDAQLAIIERCIKLTISAAEGTAVGSEECNGSTLIFDPEEGTILSVAASCMDRHPMWHASMLAVDLVAKHQGGGTWKLNCSFEDQIDDQLKRKHNATLPLRYPTSMAKLEMPVRGSLSFTKADHEKKNMDVKRELHEKCGPYLCTGYWAFLLQEPCPLCAMALLHSRVSRIFYGAANPRTGILGSRETLHSVPGLNHRYQVWSGALEKECVRTLEKCRKID